MVPRYRRPQGLHVQQPTGTNYQLPKKIPQDSVPTLLNDLFHNAMRCTPGLFTTRSVLYVQGDSSWCVCEWRPACPHLLLVGVKDPTVFFAKSGRAIAGILNKCHIPAGLGCIGMFLLWRLFQDVSRKWRRIRFIVLLEVMRMEIGNMNMLMLCLYDVMR